MSHVYSICHTYTSPVTPAPPYYMVVAGSKTGSVGHGYTFIAQRYPNPVEKAIYHQRFFGTQLFLFLSDFFEEIGYQKTSGEKIAFST